MSRTEVRVVVLFEDDAHERFLRRLVNRLHLNPVRYEKCVDCNGVLDQLGREVEILRRKKDQKNLGLIAVIDADDVNIRKRLEQLQHVMESVGETRGQDERIALLIPAWEIETWYVHLCCPEARPVDEARSDYKKDDAWKRLEREIGSAAKRAVDAWLPEVGRQDPPSLLAARAELLRLT
jgi:hypothetical protein